jgi:hypothetical protein
MATAARCTSYEVDGRGRERQCVPLDRDLLHREVVPVLREDMNPMDFKYGVKIRTYTDEICSGY